MTSTIPAHYEDQFGANVTHLVQQKGSKLRNTVKVEMVHGESIYHNQLASTEAVQLTSRFQDTPRIDPVHKRRRLTTSPWVWAALIDDIDKVKLVKDPASDYTLAAVRSLGRTIDDTIIDAVDGTAYTGQNGATSQAFDSNMIVDVQVTWPGVTAADSGLNVAKLLEARKKLLQGDVDPDEEFFMPVNARQIDSLLKDERVASSDYNTIKPLQEGKIGYYAGFTLVPTNRIGTDTNSDDKVPYYCKSGIWLGFARDIQTKISERADKNHNTQVWSKMDLGATRLEEEKVGYIECDPTSGPTGA